MRYVDGRPVGVNTVVISTQHSPDVSHATMREAVIEELIKKTIPEQYLDKRPSFTSIRPAASSSADRMATAG